MTTIERFEIRIAGFGGQGIVTIGRILGTAFTVFEKKNSVNTQSYGPESRGGTCRSEVVVSEGDINYPYVRNADVFVCLSQMAFDIYRSDLKQGGVLIVDPNSVKTVSESNPFHLFEVPATKIAHEIGNVKFQNTVALGALYQLIKDRLTKTSLRAALSENFSAKTLKANLKAFEKGLDHIRTHYAITD